jgi:hypothetical protein
MFLSSLLLLKPGADVLCLLSALVCHLLLQAHFINIKVDREERPDVDRVYVSVYPVAGVLLVVCTLPLQTCVRMAVPELGGLLAHITRCTGRGCISVSQGGCVSKGW